MNHNLPVVFGALTFANWNEAEVTRTGEIPMPETRARSTGGHALMIVGFDVESGAFILRNSWSTKWGDKGYGYMPAEYVLNADLCADFWTAFLMSRTEQEIEEARRHATDNA